MYKSTDRLRGGDLYFYKMLFAFYLFGSKQDVIGFH
jgi:hypothetical protein